MIKQSSDLFGMVSSSLCVAHCLFTPVLFVVQSNVVSPHDAFIPFWWSMIDYVFIIIAFLYIYRSAKITTKPWMRYAFYISWLWLTLSILDEKLQVFSIPEISKYLSAFTLIVLHVYNRYFCSCNKDDSCCSINESKKSSFF